jgi:hypothetical protein
MHLRAMTDQYRPKTDHQRWLVGQMAAAAARIDRCNELRPFDLGRVQERAEGHWDMDRDAEADQLAARIGRDPLRVTRALSRTRQGLQRLSIGLELLRDVLEAGGSWTEARRESALNLLGFAHELREDNPGLPELTDTEGWTEMISGEIALLGRREESLAALDERDRELAMLGLPIVEDAVTRRLRRGEAEAHRALKRARDELLRTQALETPGGDTAPWLASSPSSTGRPAPPLPRPVASGRTPDPFEDLSMGFPALTLVPAEPEDHTAEAPQPDTGPLPEPQSQPRPSETVQAAPRLVDTLTATRDAAPEPEPVRSSDTRPMDQAESMRRDRKRRRQLEKRARAKGRRGR